ncbi:MAG: CsbD family protein [Acidobacteriota bacterium]|nr:CsbD family protein [Acidobacteriota bacterium]
MGLPNKDEVKGNLDQAKGAVKENVGRAIGDRDMETEGQADRAGGKVQEGYGEAKRNVGEAVKDVGDAIKR